MAAHEAVEGLEPPPARVIGPAMADVAAVRAAAARNPRQSAGAGYDLTM
jgi:hypothetical protein